MSSPQTAKNGEIIPRTEKPKADLAELLTRMQPEIARAVPKHVNPDRMVRIALTSLRMNPDLLKCTPASFLGGVMSAAQLGLEIGGPLALAYLIPFKTECTLVVSYRGMMNLARRSGMVQAIYAYDVREGDRFSYKLGLNPDIDHEPSGDAAREEKPITHVYAVAKLKDGEPIFTVLTRAQVERYRQRSRAKDSGPWITDYAAMALKTAVRRLFTWLPQSSEMALASALDEAPELGQRQAAVWDPSVTEALEAKGYDVAGELAVTGADPETGEVPLKS
jgi:recombination protein RecT